MFRKTLTLALLLGTAAAMAQEPAAPMPPPAPQTAAPGQASLPADDQAGGLIVDVEGGTSQPTPIAIPVMPTPAVVQTPAGARSEERRVGKECEVPCRSRGSPYH